MPFGDFVERGVERVKIKLGLAGNRTVPSFDDLHAAIGEALQHIADEKGSAAPAAPPTPAPARDLDQAKNKSEDGPTGAPLPSATGA